MGRICKESIMTVSAEEIYELSKKLYESYNIMKKIDDEAAKMLIQMSSDTLDLLEDSRFTKEQSEEIDRIVEELDE